MESRKLLTASILNVSSQASIDIKNNPIPSFKAIIAVCLKYIDKKKLIENTVPDLFVDWEFVDNVKTDVGAGNLLGDSHVWIEMMNFVNFGGLQVSETVLKRNYPPLWCIYQSLRTSHVLEVDHDKRLDANGKQLRMLYFDDVCKLFILNNIQGLQGREVTDQYTAIKLNKNTVNITANLQVEPSALPCVFCYLVSFASRPKPTHTPSPCKHAVVHGG